MYLFKVIVNDGVEVEVVIKIVTAVIGKNWKSLARQLNFSKTDIDSIEYNNAHNLKEQIAQLFIQWKRREGPLETTPQALVDGLLKADLQTTLKVLEEKYIFRKIGTKQYTTFFGFFNLKNIIGRVKRASCTLVMKIEIMM